MRSRSALPALLALIVGGAALGALADDSERPDAPTKKCVSVSTSTPYNNYGYDHVVTLTAACSKPQRCTVSTNVNPTPVTVELGATETRSVVTFKGSPAREFTAQVSCQPAG